MARKILKALAGVNVTFTLGALSLVVISGFNGDTVVMEWAIVLAVINILLLIAGRIVTMKRNR